MKKVIKILSVIMALIIVLSGCSIGNVEKPDNTKNITPVKHFKKQKISPAPFGIDIVACYNDDGQISEIEYNHPEFPDKHIFNYDATSKLTNIYASYYYDGYYEAEYEDEEECVAEIQYTKNSQGEYDGRATISLGDAFNLARGFALLDSYIEEVNSDCFAFIYLATYDIAEMSGINNKDMDNTDLSMLGKMEKTEIHLKYTSDCKLKEITLHFSKGLNGSAGTVVWEYKKAYDSSSHLSEWVLGNRKVTFQYSEDKIIATRFLGEAQMSITEKTYDNENKLDTWNSTAYSDNEMTADITLVDGIEKIAFFDVNGNQTGTVTSKYDTENINVVEKTLQLKNQEMRQNILANQDMWAYDEGDFPRMELVTHTFIWEDDVVNNNPIDDYTPNNSQGNYDKKDPYYSSNDYNNDGNLDLDEFQGAVGDYMEQHGY